MRALKQYLWNILVAIDQLLNTVLFGDPDETISSRCGKRVREKNCILCGWLCTILHFIDPGHCHDSIEPDEGKR